MLKKLFTCDDMADDMDEIELLGIDWAMRWHFNQMPPVIYNERGYPRVAAGMLTRNVSHLPNILIFIEVLKVL